MLLGVDFTQYSYHSEMHLCLVNWHLCYHLYQ